MSGDLPLFDSSFALSPGMMQRREGESPEEHIARITVRINKVTEVRLQSVETIDTDAIKRL